MVKGTTRQVIVVRSPDPKLFEQAVFFLREDALEKHGVDEAALLEQARRLAESGTQRKKKPRSTAFWFALGALPMAVGWLITVFLM